MATMHVPGTFSYIYASEKFLRKHKLNKPYGKFCTRELHNILQKKVETGRSSSCLLNLLVSSLLVSLTGGCEPIWPCFLRDECKIIPPGTTFGADCSTYWIRIAIVSYKALTNVYTFGFAASSASGRETCSETAWREGMACCIIRKGTLRINPDIPSYEPLPVN